MWTEKKYIILRSITKKNMFKQKSHVGDEMKTAMVWYVCVCGYISVRATKYFYPSLLISCIWFMYLLKCNLIC